MSGSNGWPMAEMSGFRLVTMAQEYCHLIDGFPGVAQDHTWLSRMHQLLPRLHVAVLNLSQADLQCRGYLFPDDDQRCELYLRLLRGMKAEAEDAGAGALRERGRLCDHLADDFTDMYFDLKDGLERYQEDPQLAIHMWLSSFYLHWGIHLLDAESRLHAVAPDARRH